MSSRSLKICIISQEYGGAGGIGTQSYLKAQGLSLRGHEVHVVSASSGSSKRIDKDGDATIHRIAAPTLPVLGYEESSSWLTYSCAVARILTELEREIGFDIMQFPEYGGEGFLYQTDSFANTTSRFVVQLHGPLAMFS